MGERYTLDNSAAKNVQAYIDYVNVVGHQEGPLMSESILKTIYKIRGIWGVQRETQKKHTQKSIWVMEKH